MSKRYERFTTPHDDYVAGNDNYELGVRKAQGRDSVRQACIKASLAAFVGFGVDNDATNAAKERSDARKAKYGEKASRVVRVIVVPKGSVPVRVNPFGNLARRGYRYLKRFLTNKGVPSDQIDEHIEGMFTRAKGVDEA